MISFFVHGNPKPKGSFKAFIPKHGKRPIVTHDNKGTKPWQSLVSLTAAQKMEGKPIISPPVHIGIFFKLKRPKSLKKSVINHTKKPDLDKLVRCVMDALKGIAYEDDSHIVFISAGKRYIDPNNVMERCGAEILIGNGAYK